MNIGRMKFLLVVGACLASQFVHAEVASAKQLSVRAWQILHQIEDQIGARPAGSQAEQDTAKTLAAIWQQAGLKVQQQAFEFSLKGRVYQSRNLWVTLPGRGQQHLLIGAHYDSTGEQLGSTGATDNGMAMALVTALGEQLAQQQLNMSVTLVLFGGEEMGLQGSKAFVGRKVTKLPDVMLNLDTIGGGDVLYVHSAASEPYELCADADQYQSSAILRDRLLTLSEQQQLGFALHPDYPGYPQGETGDWSDHAPFACAGVPVAYIEATNFALNGEEGYDGYSQSTQAGLWDCYEAKSLGACDRESETHWGKIWHTRHDRLDDLEQRFPGRLQDQLDKVSTLISLYLQEQ